MLLSRAIHLKKFNISPVLSSSKSLIRFRSCNRSPPLRILQHCCSFASKNSHQIFATNKLSGYRKSTWYHSCISVFQQGSRRGYHGNMHRVFTQRYMICGFHTSSRKDAWPVAALLVKLVGPLSNISKLTAMVGGRSFRKWYKKLSPHYKQILFIDKRKEKIILVVGGLSGISIGYYIFHLEETPFTHRTRFMPIGNLQMEQLTESEYKHALELCGESILPVNHPDHIKVFQVTKQLVTGNQSKEMEGMKWQVNVVDTPDVNAFVLPNGQIFMFKGMLNLLPNDSALATILGHEMAHAILRHGAEQASLHGVINLFIVVSLAILWAILPTDYLAIAAQWIQDQILTILVHLPYSRKLEEEADEVGMLFAAKACYDVRESPKIWQKLDGQQKEEGKQDVEWFSTHPSHANRANNLDVLLPEALEIRRKCNCPSLELLSFDKTRQPRLMKLLGLNTSD